MNPNPKQDQRKLWGQFLVFTGPLVATGGILTLLRTRGTPNFSAFYVVFIALGLGMWVAGLWMWTRR